MQRQPLTKVWAGKSLRFKLGEHSSSWINAFENQSYILFCFTDIYIYIVEQAVSFSMKSICEEPVRI